MRDESVKVFCVYRYVRALEIGVLLDSFLVLRGS